MKTNSRRISLAHLTVIDAHPLELIDAAAAGAFDCVGLRLVAPTTTDRIVPVVGQRPLIYQIKRRLSDTGVDVLDIEAIWLTAETDVESYLPVFDTAAQLGARNLLVVGNDPDPARVAANFARMCELSHPFGLRVMLEFIPYCHTSTIHAAQAVALQSGCGNAGVLIDALHLSRSGATPADIAILEPSMLAYCQICDARALPPPRGGLRTEARTDRFYPGRGQLPLFELMRALPPGIDVGVEAPCLEHAGMSVIERGHLCGMATTDFFRAFDAADR
ncbi:sugar phosphate isomerase/epimerase family protein [Bradyrhizobium sp. CCBAU 11361]|uniref:sugar phosphate isomerase/epimerase family protein n=1 Tax=Bradyrhizobium sp. CCBAU 11361 TaxID=1630812 RepID=UPI0023043091|nr:TIM barrel protein [Bradyrhizobium sp. CCBAU 11361]